MKKFPHVLAVLTCGLLLGACNSSSPISTGSGPSTEVGTLATVKLLVQFPKSSGPGIQPQGVPQSAAKAKVSIYDGTTLIGQKEVAKTSGGSQELAFKLPSNRTYRFSMSIYDGSTVAKEIAWGAVDFEVRTDATITVPLKSILDSVSLTASGTPGNKEFLLSVLSPNGEVPLNDFEVTYSVTGGQVASQSKLGVIIDKLPGQTTVVTASVLGLGADHQPKTIVTSKNLSRAGLTLNGTFKDFPAGYGKPLLIQGTTLGGQPVTGKIQPGGKYVLTLPDVTDEIKPLSDFYRRPSRSDQKINYKITPSDTKGTEVIDKYENGSTRISERALNIKTELGATVGFIWIDAGDYLDRSFDGLIYVDQDVKIQDLRANGSITEIKSGWNIGFKAVRYPYTFIPLVGASGTANESLTMIVEVGDAYVEHTADTTTPIPGSEINHVVQFRGKTEQKIEMAIPRSLKLLGDIMPVGAQVTCDGPVSTPSASIYTCGAPSNSPGGNWKGSLKFKTRAEGFDTYKPDPNEFLVRLIGGNFIDTIPVNNSTTLSFVRQLGTADVVIRSDLQAPNLTFNSPASPKAGQLMTLGGSVSDNVAPTLVEVYAGVTLLGKATLVGQPINAWTFPWTPDAAGAYVLTVVAHDAAGNTARTQRAVTVTTP